MIQVLCAVQAEEMEGFGEQAAASPRRPGTERDERLRSDGRDSLKIRFAGVLFVARYLAELQSALRAMIER
jgi:hypothetical protein